MSADPATAAARNDRPCRTGPASPVLVARTGAPEAHATGDWNPGWAALGPRTTGRSRTTAASNSQPTAQVSSHFRAFPQVVR